MVSKLTSATILTGGLLALIAGAPAQAQWKPTKPVEFLGAAGPGGGTDIFNRTVQSIIQKYNLVEQPILVTPKGGGSGAEAFVYVKAAAGDPHKLVFGTSNLYTLPLVAKVAFKHTDFAPVAAMVFDEFILWNKGDSEWKDYKSFTDAAKAANGTFKMAGALSKDTDQTLTRFIEKDTGAKFIYIPYKSGSEASVQLSGGHVMSHVNNPSESVGHWKAGQVKPLCVFSERASAQRRRGRRGQGLGRHPDLQGAGRRHRGIQDAAHHRLAAGLAEGGGRLLGGRVQEGERDPGMEAVSREHLADGPLHGRRRIEEIRRRGRAAHPQDVRGRGLAR